MKNFKFIISYDGSRYFGWERQPGRDTIQGKLEAVLTRMCGTDVQVIGAGRTDAGVHAKAMAANAYMDTEKTPDEVRDYMNRYLPDDICVQEAKLAADRFHARYRAVGKLYTYTCYVGDTKPVFNRKYVTVLDYQPDLAAMQRAAEYLTGEHDYKSFCSNPQMKKSTVRIVDSIEIVRRKDLLYFNYHGTGFLQNMVRILTGTLLEVGQGKRTPESVKTALEAKDRTQAGYTAPPQGLCLMRVDYGPHRSQRLPGRGAVSRRMTERLYQICIEKPKPQIQFAVWKGRNGLRGKEAPRTAGTRSVEAGSDAPPTAQSFLSQEKRLGRKECLGTRGAFCL